MSQDAIKSIFSLLLQRVGFPDDLYSHMYIDQMTKNTSKVKSLDILREEIDSIDEKIHALLMRRAGIASDVKDVKKASLEQKNFIRPAREAQILRKLVEKHDGIFPNTLIVRIWREIISATLSLESDFTVAVISPDDLKSSLAYELLARSYFGMDTPIRSVGTESGVLRSVRDGKSSVGVVPVPHDDRFSDSENPWWTILASGGLDRPMIISRLPWCINPQDTNNGLEGLSVACVKPEETGNDMTYIALSLVKPISRGKIKEALLSSGLVMEGVAVANPREKNGDSRWQLFEVNGYITETDLRLEKFSAIIGEALGLLSILGSYARPIRL